MLEKKLQLESENQNKIRESFDSIVCLQKYDIFSSGRIRINLHLYTA